MLAYLQRKRFEAKVIWAALGDGLSKKGDDEKMSFSELSAIGFGIRGGK